MISINLIPDVKLEMLRAQKTRNFAITISIIIGLASVAVVVALSLVVGAQAIAESEGNKKIDEQIAKLQTDNENLNDMLTIKQQLGYISDINANKTKKSRLLDLISAINPSSPDDMKFSKVLLDPVEKVLTIEGSAYGGFTSTDVFRKTILHTTIEAIERGAVSEGTDQSDAKTITPLTEEVSLQNMSYGENAEGVKVLSFRVSFVYPDELFSNIYEKLEIVTPTGRIDVTDSKTRIPDSIFNEKVKTDQEDN